MSPPAEAAARGEPVRWGFLSTARINQRVLVASRRSDRFEVAAVASRDLDKARRYAGEQGIAKAHGSYEELLADDEVEAIYVSLPNHLHVEWSARALEAGKHVLCEKPLTPSPDHAAALLALARSCERQLSEGFMWRHHPQTRALERLLRQGAIGRVEEVRAAFGFDLAQEWSGRGSGGPGGSWRDDIRLRPEADGGALMDVGAYCVNALRLVAGEPRQASATQEAGPTGVDLRTSGQFEHDGGAVGHFECFVDAPRREELEIRGEEGSLIVRCPFLCHEPGIEARTSSGTHELPIALADSYQCEFEDFSTAIRSGEEPDPGAGEIVAQATAMDAIRSAARTGETWQASEQVDTKEASTSDR